MGGEPAPHLDLDEIGEESEPSCTFTLGGKKWSCRQIEDVPWGVVEKMLAVGQDAEKAMVQIGPFFRAVLVPEEVPSFEAMLNSPDSPLTLRRVMPLVQHLSSAVMQRPTGRALPSTTGSRKTRRTSVDASSSPATAPKASAG